MKLYKGIKKKKKRCRPADPIFLAMKPTIYFKRGYVYSFPIVIKNKLFIPEDPGLADSQATHFVDSGLFCSKQLSQSHVPAGAANLAAKLSQVPPTFDAPVKATLC